MFFSYLVVDYYFIDKTMYIKNIILILKNSISVKEKIERLLKDEAIKVSVDQETVNERD